MAYMYKYMLDSVYMCLYICTCVSCNFYSSHIVHVYMYAHVSCALQPNGMNTLLPSANGMGDLSQPREAASDDSNLHPVGKKMSAPGILQPYNQVMYTFCIACLSQ